MRKIYESNIINHDTGEILKSHTVYSKKIEYHYSQYNDQFAEEIINLTGHELKMIMLLEITAHPVTNEPIGRKSEKIKICEMLNLGNGAYYNLRYILRKKGMLIDHNGIAIVNPEYFWRGTVKDREILLEEIRNNRLNEVA